MIATVLDLLGGLLLVAGTLLALVAAIGVLRMPDVLTRMHTQGVGTVSALLTALAGVALLVRTPAMFGSLALVAFFQLLTSPVGSHLIGRSARRVRQHRGDLLGRDDLSD